MKDNNMIMTFEAFLKMAHKTSVLVAEPPQDWADKQLLADWSALAAGMKAAVGIPCANVTKLMDAWYKGPRSEDFRAYGLDNVPAGWVAIFPHATMMWFASEETSALLARLIRLARPVLDGAKMTYEEIRKYIGSLITCKEVAFGRMFEGDKVVDVKKMLPHLYGKIDGQVFVAASWAAQFGWTGYTIRRIVTRHWFIKGQVVVLPDSYFPVNCPIISDSLRVHLDLNIPEGKVVGYTPGTESKTTYESAMSLQGWLMAYGSQMASEDFKKMLFACEQNALDKLPRKLAGLEKIRAANEDVQDDDTTSTADESRDERFTRAFVRLGVSPMIMKHMVKAMADNVTKDFDINTLKVRASTPKMSLIWNAYVLIMPWRIFAEVHEVLEQNVPNWLNTKAAIQASLPTHDADGRILFHATEMDKFNKDNSAPNRTGMSRKPSSFTSGPIVALAKLPETLIPEIVGGKKGEFQIWWDIDLIGENPNCKFMTKQELMLLLDGEDCDDNNDLTRGIATELIERNLPEKAQLDATWAAAQNAETKEGKILAEIEKKIQDGLDAVSNPGNERFATIWNNSRSFGLSNLLCDLFEVKWNKGESLPTVARHVEPTESYIPASAVGSQGMLFDVLNVSNPFEYSLSSIAQAQQGARNLLVPGMIELPEELEPYRTMLALRILKGATLSDVVDAANKGKGFSAAWETLRIAYETWTYIGLVLWGKNIPLRIQPELLMKLPRGIKMGFTKALSYEKAKDPITGAEISVPVTDKDGRPVKTLLRHEALENQLWAQRREFFNAVELYLNNQAEMVNKEGRHNIIPMMIERFISDVADLRNHTPKVKDKHIGVKDWASKVYRQFFMTSVTETMGGFEFSQGGRTINKIWLDRQAAFGEWLAQNNGHVDLVEKQMRLSWSRQPYYWALAAMQAFVCDQLPEDNKAELYEEFLLAFNLVAGWSNLADRPITIAYNKKTGRFTADGGLNLLVFMVGNDDFMGPGDALLNFLESGYGQEFAREIDAKRFDRKVTVYFSVHEAAREIEIVNNAKIDHGIKYELESFVGCKIDAILSAAGIQLAGPAGVFGGHPNQERGLTFIAQRIKQLRTDELMYLRDRIKDLKRANPIADHTDTRTLDEILDDKDTLLGESQWANFVRFGLSQQLLELLKYPAISAELVSIPLTKEEIEKNCMPKEFLKLSFGLTQTEIENGDEDKYSEQDEAYAMYKADKAELAGELADWTPSDDEEESCVDTQDGNDEETFSDDEESEETEEIETQDVPEEVEEEKMKIQAPAVVRYEGQVFAFYGTSGGGLFAKLLDRNGVKVVGTPSLSKLEFVKAIETKEFNGHNYFKTKAGWVASCSTGNIVTDKNILALFEEKPEPPTPPMVAPVVAPAPAAVAAPAPAPQSEPVGFQMEMDFVPASDRIVLNDEQQAIYDAIVHGTENLMVTGNAGTGKSTTIKEAIKGLQQKRHWVRVCATTGIAASHIGGRTYHSALMLFPNLSADKCSQKMKGNKALMDYLLRPGSVAIIDEVSMMSSAEVDRMDEALRLATGKNEAFGGLRVIFVGDFLQIEPVQKVDENKEPEAWMKTPFAFQSKAWKTGKVRTMKLTKVVRQADEHFVGFLNNLRLGNVTTWMEHNLKRLKARAIPERGAIHIFTTNQACETHNEREMDKLTGSAFSIKANDENAAINDFIQEDWYRTEKSIRVKVGAQVIHLVNSRETGLMNGDIGTIVDINKETQTIVVHWDRLNLTYPHVRVVDPKDGDPEAKQYRLQFPFKTAWGITVHKSQGMTLDKAVIAVGGSFAAGQVYVAMSRLRTLDGLYLRSYDIDTISASQVCLDFYGEKGNLRGADADAMDQLKGNK